MFIILVQSYLLNLLSTKIKFLEDLFGGMLVTTSKTARRHNRVTTSDKRHPSSQPGERLKPKKNNGGDAGSDPSTRQSRTGGGSLFLRKLRNVVVPPAVLCAHEANTISQPGSAVAGFTFYTLYPALLWTRVKNWSQGTRATTSSLNWVVVTSNQTSFQAKFVDTNEVNCNFHSLSRDSLHQILTKLH